jgi:ribosomal protein S18 acetylase RimI-like enzyme
MFSALFTVGAVVAKDIEAWCSTQVDNVQAQALHRALGFEEAERVVFFRKRLIC